MRREFQVLCALALDGAVGDPRWFPHPVRLMGRVATALEAPARRAFRSEKTAGIAVAAAVVGGSAVAAWGSVRGAERIHPLAGDVVSIAVMWTGIAARDLGRHGLVVAEALEAGELDRARQAVSWMVGRDTEALDEESVARAAVESVAENTVDGVTAPLMWAFAGGAPALMAFKAVSTLDSTFGYKNERFLHFGWASARLDDVANYVPARLTVPFMGLAAALGGLDTRRCLQTALRDGDKHPSPNSGLAEAATAGALGVRLGGPVTRGGEPGFAPYLGEPSSPLGSSTIRQAVTLMWLTTVLVALGSTLVRAASVATKESRQGRA